MRVSTSLSFLSQIVPKKAAPLGIALALIGLVGGIVSLYGQAGYHVGKFALLAEMDRPGAITVVAASTVIFILSILPLCRRSSESPSSNRPLPRPRLRRRAALARQQRPPLARQLEVGALLRRKAGSPALVAAAPRAGELVVIKKGDDYSLARCHSTPDEGHEHIHCQVEKNEDHASFAHMCKERVYTFLPSDWEKE